MCGIAGIISKNSSFVNEERVREMTNILAHRGPDGEGAWINENSEIGLGHRRLSVIDLSPSGQQPMHYADRYTIVHNGEIYNYLELRDELKTKGFSFFTKTDTEVIVAAYDHWGEDCVDHFDGMFAFAIWDSHKKILFAARDRFGEKPFFYFFNDEEFVFASEMKAIWKAGIQKKVNLKLLFNFLTIGYTDNPNIPEETFFTSINKLPAASCLKFSFDDFQLNIYNYWDIEVDNQNKKISDKDAIEQFNHLFKQSINRRLRSDVPIGTSLSGGLDSSSVVASLQSSDNSKPVQAAFTSIFPGFEKNEYEFAKTVTDKFKLNHYTIEPDASYMYNELEKIFYFQEEPFTSASIIPQYKVYGLAKDNSIKVLLDGQGADEILAGYFKYYKWYWQELFRKRKISLRHELEAAKKLGIKEKFGWRNMVAAIAPEFASIFLERRYLVNALRQEDLTPEFVRFQSKEAYYETPEIFSLNGVLYFNTCIHGLEELLRYADRNSMAHGREVRLPFLSHELVEFVFSLPANFKIRNGWTKWILRDTMKDQLPEKIVWRKDKTGFEPPQKEWMQNKAVQELIMESQKILVKENILKPDVLNKKIEAKNSYEPKNYVWRYLTSSFLFK